jgi:predicted DCC family thiol-disulfide oxidoreductase YuxK
MNAIYPLTLYYESAWALCNGEMTNLRLRNTEGLLRFVDVSDPAFDTPPPGTRKEDLLALMHGLKADGSVIRGVEVFRLAYAAVGLPGVTRALELPVVGPLAERLYPWIARHRHRVPRWVTHLLFETAIRRAAERAAVRRCVPGGSCRL